MTASQNTERKKTWWAKQSMEPNACNPRRARENVRKQVTPVIFASDWLKKRHFWVDWFKHKARVSIQLLSRRKTLLRKTCLTYYNQSERKSFSPSDVNFITKRSRDDFREKQHVSCFLSKFKSVGNSDTHLLLVWRAVSISLFPVYTVSLVFTGRSRLGVRTGVRPGGGRFWPFLPLALSVTTSPPSPVSSPSVRTVEWISNVWNKWWL